MPKGSLAGCVLLACLLGPAAGCANPLAPSAIGWSCQPSAATATDADPVFRSPFDGTFSSGNVFDHDKPLFDADPSGKIVTMCGAAIRQETNGHPGYDFMMPEGTVLRAVADGSVLFAGLEPPLYCPPIGQTVQALVVELRHLDARGHDYVSVYGHLSRIDVSDGQPIHDGDPIGLSGNTGCSGSPHLHFGVFRKSPSGGYVVIDPYGWNAATLDPWEADSRGTRSVWMWRPGQAPALVR